VEELLLFTMVIFELKFLYSRTCVPRILGYITGGAFGTTAQLHYPSGFRLHGCTAPESHSEKKAGAGLGKHAGGGVNDSRTNANTSQAESKVRFEARTIIHRVIYIA
jgi:hypothetical protein